MKIAIDIDGTIGRYPERFAGMMTAFKKQGHQVIVLTGAGTHAERTASLSKRGINQGTEYDGLNIVTGSNLNELAAGKAGFLHGWAADVFVDDCELYCEYARRLCPGLMILRVFP
jgi:hypothetical protein